MTIFVFSRFIINYRIKDSGTFVSSIMNQYPKSQIYLIKVTKVKCKLKISQNNTELLFLPLFSINPKVFSTIENRIVI